MTCLTSFAQHVIAAMKASIMTSNSTLMLDLAGQSANMFGVAVRQTRTVEQKRNCKSDLRFPGWALIVTYSTLVLYTRQAMHLVDNYTV